MISLLLTMALGGLVGFVLRTYRISLLSVFIQLVICLLLFFLGLELGADRMLLDKIGTLGLQAGAITLGAMTGSLILVAMIDRLFFKEFKKNTLFEQTQAKHWGFVKNSVSIIICFMAGLICAIISRFTSSITSDIVLGLLYILLFLVGISIGKENKALCSIKQQGYRIFLLPAGTLIGTLVGAAIAGWLLPHMRIWDSMAIGSGMGYYSLSSVLLSHSKGAEISSIALLSNILRELLTLFTAPLLIKTFGKLAPISAGGVTSMDITLPVIIRFSGKEYAVLAIFHGAILDPLVPVLVGFFGSI